MGTIQMHSDELLLSDEEREWMRKRWKNLDLMERSILIKLLSAVSELEMQNSILRDALK